MVLKQIKSNRKINKVIRQVVYVLEATRERQRMQVRVHQ